MQVHCPTCRKPLRPAAKFCGRCGEPTLSTPPPVVILDEEAGEESTSVAPPTVPAKRSGGGTGLLIVIFLLSMSTLMLFQFARLKSRGASNQWHSALQHLDHLPAVSPEVRRAYDIGATRAALLYDLFKDKDISVRVGLRGDTLSAAGTQAEIEVIESIVGILERERRGPAKPRRPRSLHPFMERSYELGRDRARHFVDVLSLAGWSINLKRDGGRVIVTASEEDQRHIAALVEILRGRVAQSNHNHYRR